MTRPAKKSKKNPADDVDMILLDANDTTMFSNHAIIPPPPEVSSTDDPENELERFIMNSSLGSFGQGTLDDNFTFVQQGTIPYNMTC